MTPEEVYARRRCVLTVRTGSNLYGTVVSATPDHDEMGIFVEDKDTIFSVDPKQHTRLSSVTYRTAGTREDGTDALSTGEDTDGQLYSLSHFMRETAKGNPNTMTILYAPGSAILNQTPRKVTSELRLHREAFISSGMGYRYLGYLRNQRKAYLDSDIVKRPELVARYGFDTKGAYHALRVALQGHELLSTGSLELPMKENYRQYLIGVRKGDFSKDEVIEHLTELESFLEAEVMKEDWPLKPDYRLLTKLNQYLHELYWGYQDEQSKFPQ